MAQSGGSPHSPAKRREWWGAGWQGAARVDRYRVPATHVPETALALTVAQSRHARDSLCVKVALARTLA